jgi:hypothetical protein
MLDVRKTGYVLKYCNIYSTDLIHLLNEELLSCCFIFWTRAVRNLPLQDCISKFHY